MQNLDKALLDIAALRTQMARSSEFKGYGPTTLTATGVLAVVAALLQARWVPDPRSDVLAYLAVWLVTAGISAIIVGIEVVTRTRRAHSGLADTMIFLTLEQLVPAAVAGALLTSILVSYAPSSLWLLPGLWQILLSLGVFATSRSLPRPMMAVGVWYMATGLGSIAFARGDSAFSPWTMGLPFGGGQLLAAALHCHFGQCHEGE